MIRWTILLTVFLITLAASAQIRQMTDLERVGTADLIVAGTIQKVVDSGKATGVMTVRVGRVLKGTAGETVDIHNLRWLRGKAVEAFGEGKEFLFFMQSMREGYVLPRGMASIYPTGHTDVIANLVKNYPLTLTVAEPLGPIVIGRRMPVTITLKNNTDKPIGVSEIELLGFFLSPEMDATLSNTVGPEINGHHVAIWQVETIEPGKEFTVNLEFAGELPAAWKMKPPAPGTAAEVKIRFRVTVDLETPRKRDADTYYMNSPLFATKVVMAETKPVEEKAEE